MSEPDEPERKTRSSAFFPADDEDTDRIVNTVLGRFSSGVDPEPPARLTIDRYINAELHALGGMGRVFVAYDPVLERTVALKALPVGLAPHEPAAATPRREGKALAGLDHPNIIRVYEIVEHRGLECLVLEHVSGVDLSVWLRTAPRDWREILGKFLGAGEGLAAVHRAGFVHRDFKPANVLIGDNGSVKLVDFGLAVRAGALAPGDPEICAGTPRLMAPEQIQRKEATAASDQYSFCVALYEALFGVHPYLPSDIAPPLEPAATLSSQAELESRRVTFGAILRATLQRPEKLPPGLPGHILPALLRGLAIEPARRFPSMEALLAELRRDPRPARRHQLLGLGVCAALTGVLSYFLWGYPPSVSSDELAEQLWGGRKAALMQKLAGFGKASEGLTAAVNNWVKAYYKYHRDRDRGEPDAHLAACLQRQKWLLSEILDDLEHGDDATVTTLVGRFDALLTDKECERPDYRCGGSPPEALERGKAALFAGRYTDAARWARFALDQAMSERQVGREAQARIILGRIEYEQDRLVNARGELTRAVMLAEQHGCRDLAAEGYNWLTKVAAFDPQVPLARAEDYSTHQEWFTLPTDAAGYADMLSNRALVAERRAGDLSRAAELLHEAIEKRRDAELDQSVAQAESYLNLSSVRLNQGQLDAAEAALREAQARRERLLGLKHPLIYKERLNLGHIAFARQRLPDARTLYSAALEVINATMSPHSPAAATLHRALARTYDRLGHREAALAEAMAAAEIFSRLPADEPERDESLENVAQALIAMERFEEAIPWLSQVEASLAGKPAVSPERRGILDFRWADALNGVKQHHEAEKRARQALRRFDEAGVAEGDPLRANAALFLAEALFGQQRWQEAIAPFEQAAEIWTASGDNPEMLSYALAGLAKSLCQLPGRREEAREKLRSLSLIDPPPNRHISEEAAALCGLR